MKDIKDKDVLVKSYKLLVLWFLLLFVIAGLSLALLAKLDLSSKVISLMMYGFINLFLVSLFLMIYKTERVYYINYITHKEAQDATPEERRAFAYKHLRVFGISTIIYIAYSFFSLRLNYPTVMDILVFAVVIIISAIRTIPFKLKK